MKGTDSRYLQLFTEEHALLKNESNLMNDYKVKENEERDLFFSLSASLRDSQEKERARAERLKYLQFGLSIACTTLGIFSAFIYNYMKSSSINEILRHEKEQFGSVKEIISSIVAKQEQLELSIAKNHAILKDNLDIIQNESLKLITQISESNRPEKPSKELESSLVALIESALKETDSLKLTQQEEILNSKIKEPVIEEEIVSTTIPVKSNFLNQLKQHKSELLLVSVAFLIGTFLFYK